MSKGQGSEITYITHKPSSIITKGAFTRWFKYDRDDLCVNKSQFVPVIFEPPCTSGGAMLTNSGRLVSQTNNS